MSTLTQTLVDSAVPIVLDPDVTYLNQTSPDSPLITNNMVLPNGNNVNQTKRILVSSATILTSATWVFAGAFAGGFTKLQFDRVGYNALLQWDGSGWQLLSGNATLVP